MADLSLYQFAAHILAAQSIGRKIKRDLFVHVIHHHLLSVAKLKIPLPHLLSIIFQSK
jgi:hypothetical protein